MGQGMDDGGGRDSAGVLLSKPGSAAFSLSVPLTAIVLVVLSLWASRGLFNVPTLSWDDYRYLDILRRCNSELLCALREGTVITNRWDNQWWIPPEYGIVLIRPFVILSFLFDFRFWGSWTEGYLLTNLLLHTVCVLLFWLVWRRMTRSELLPALGAALFSLHPVHGENLYYLAGRTDTIAALLFLLALGSVVSESDRGSDKPGALVLALFFLALLGKEYNIVLPVVAAAYQRFMVPASKRYRLTSAALCFGAVCGVYLAVRAVILSQQALSCPDPYCVSVFDPSFLPHAAGTVLQGISALAVGTFVDPFLQGVAPFYARVGLVELTMGIAVTAAVIAVSLNSALGRYALAGMLVTALPVPVLYSSARYLYIPSLFFVMALFVALRDLAGAPRTVARISGALLITVAAVAWPLLRYPRQLSYIRYDGPEGELRAHVVQLLDVLQQLPPEDRLYVIDFPGGWLPVQFLQNTLDSLANRDLARVVVLTPAGAEPTQVICDSGGSIHLSRSRMPLYERSSGRDLPVRAFENGTVLPVAGGQLQITESISGAPRLVKVTLDSRGADPLVVTFVEGRLERVPCGLSGRA